MKYTRALAPDNGESTANRLQNRTFNGETENYKAVWVQSGPNTCEKFPIKKGFEFEFDKLKETT